MLLVFRIHIKCIHNIELENITIFTQSDAQHEKLCLLIDDDGIVAAVK